MNEKYDMAIEHIQYLGYEAIDLLERASYFDLFQTLLLIIIITKLYTRKKV